VSGDRLRYLQRTFDIEYPIVAFSHCRDVVIAVTKAGGLGVLGTATFTPEQLDAELDLIEKALSGKPYGVDFVVPSRYVEEPTVEDLFGRIPEAHREFVNDLLVRYDVPPLPIGEQVDLTNPLAHSRDAALRLVEATLAHTPALLVNALGVTDASIINSARSQGVLVGAMVGTPNHAVRQRSAGVDIVIAQGFEAGGHTGEIATMALVPGVVDAVDPLPVLAAGGIADGRQMAAALALGACGVWCGSVWLTSAEAETHPAVREKLASATCGDTVRTRARTGKPARQLRSAWTDEWDKASAPAPLEMPLQGLLCAEARHRLDRPGDLTAGARDLANYFVGQVVGQLGQTTTCRDVIHSMITQYVDVVEELSESS
jgi:NAD(P)H-dependent flavin oxidoreductase YrpB (nitropropane dioxygenase family)